MHSRPDAVPATAVSARSHSNRFEYESRNIRALTSPNRGGPRECPCVCDLHNVFDEKINDGECIIFCIYCSVLRLRFDSRARARASVCLCVRLQSVNGDTRSQWRCHHHGTVVYVHSRPRQRECCN